MVRPGFTLIEVIVSLVLLAAGALGLAATAVVVQRALGAAELEEQAVRHAAAVLDSLSFSTATGSDSLRIGAFHYSWSAPVGDAAVVQVSVTWSAGRAPVTVEFSTRRVPAVPVRRP